MQKCVYFLGKKQALAFLSAVTDFPKGVILLANLVPAVILCNNSPTHAALALKIHFQSPLANSQVFFIHCELKWKHKT